MLGIIGGSGLSEFPEVKLLEERAINTPYGPPSSTVIIGELQNHPVSFLARHGKPHTIPPHCVNYRANIWALKSLGVKHIIAVNAVGGISAAQNTGVVSLPDQIIDYTYGREHTFSDGADVPLQHIDFSIPYSSVVRSKLSRAAETINLPLLISGVYGATQGPRLETAAEVRRLANDGCDIVGMTGMPEAALARELDVEYACIALVVNKAAGLAEGLITMADMEAVMKSGMQQIKQLISAYTLC